MLIDRGMVDQAMQEISQHLQQHPDDADAFSLLAICETRRKKYAQATQHAERAQSLAPDDPYTHFAMAVVMQARSRYPAAQQAIDEALRLNPHVAFLHAMLAQILFQRERWKEAYESCDRALAIDPEDTLALNVKALAARNLGMNTVSDAQVMASLAADPNDDDSHTVAGWRCLDKGDRAQAARHFREALRLEPTNEVARQGMLETLRANNPFYRLLHRFFLSMSKLTNRAQWGMILGAYLLYRALLFIAENVPAAAPFIWPVLIAYLLFVFGTWFARPISNALLIFHPWGRLALNRRERWGGIITAALLACTLICGIVYFFSASMTVEYISFGGLFFFGGCSVPIALAFITVQPKARLWMSLYAATVVVAGLVMLGFGAAMLMSSDGGRILDLVRPTQTALSVFGFLAIGSAIVSNVLGSITWKD